MVFDYPLGGLKHWNSLPGTLLVPECVELRD